MPARRSSYLPDTRLTWCVLAPSELLVKVSETSPALFAEVESTSAPFTCRATASPGGKSPPVTVTPDWASSETVSCCGVTEATGSYTTGSSTTVKDAPADHSPDTRLTWCVPAPSELLVKVSETSPALFAEGESTSAPFTCRATASPGGKSPPVTVTPDWASSATGRC